MRLHRAALLRPRSVGLRIRKPGLPIPAVEWFQFSSCSPSAGIRSQIQEMTRKAKLAPLIKEVERLTLGLAARQADYPAHCNDHFCKNLECVLARESGDSSLSSF